MHNLANFIPYDGKVTSGEHVVLLWSKKSGYYFVQYGFIVDSGVKIIAKEDV